MIDCLFKLIAASYGFACDFGFLVYVSYAAFFIGGIVVLHPFICLSFLCLYSIVYAPCILLTVFLGVIFRSI